MIGEFPALLMAIEQAHESALKIRHLGDPSDGDNDHDAYEIPVEKWHRIVELHQHIKGRMGIV